MCILQLSLGLPTVKYSAKELFLSTNYFGDLIRQITGDTAGNIIRRFVMAEAQKQLISGTGITATAEHLGFDYPSTSPACSKSTSANRLPNTSGASDSPSAHEMNHKAERAFFLSEE